MLAAPSAPRNAMRLPALFLVAMLAGCGAEDTPPPTPDAPADSAHAAEGAAFDFGTCRLPGATLPVAGRLFVVDGGRPAPGAEPGRETIRRVDVFVPGPVALLLTAKDASVWHVRLGPDTRLQAVFAAGDGSQRIAGQGLGTVRLEKAGAYGDPCGRHWAQDDAQLDAAARGVFGRPYDAIYRMRTGTVVIGGPEAFPPDALGPER